MNFKYATKYVQLRSALPGWQLNNNTVIVRADLNVPLKDGIILDDQKCKAIQPTLDLILQKKAKIILLTHIGRPKNNEPDLSTRHLLLWFKQHGYAAAYTSHVNEIAPLLSSSSIVLFENVRFFDKHDYTLPAQLAPLGTHYIMDAFGSVHRDDFSLTTLAQQFKPDKRTIGLLVEKELQGLEKLIISPERPFVAILGGGKAADKLPLMQAFAQFIDGILVCPTLSNSIAHAQGLPVGKSVIDESIIENIKAFLKESKKAVISMPSDYITTESALERLLNDLKTRSATDVQSNDIIITIGPKTVDEYTKAIKSAQTIFFNGLPGFLDKPDTLVSAKALMQAMANSNAYTVIGGGDSIAAAHQFGLADKINFLSTGGGATLSLLADQQLPALEIFI